MTHYDQKNTLSISMGAVLVLGFLFVLIGVHLDNVTRVQIEEERTDRAKVEVCETIEDPAEQTLCLTAVKR